MTEIPQASGMLFPLLESRKAEVGEGQYQILKGDNRPVWLKRSELSFSIDPNRAHDLPGVYDRGSGLDHTGRSHNMVSFLYHKEKDGELETTERVILWTGTGYGVYPDHAGQAPAWYLVGPEVGRLDPQTGEFTCVVPDSVESFVCKNFSLDCITDGPLRKNPVLANQPQHV